MEKAVWNQMQVVAQEITQGSEMYWALREASRDGKLYCADPDCCERVKFRMGEKRIAHFAHVSGGECDYASHDRRNNEATKKARQILFEALNAKGYQVEIEPKLLRHRYAQLSFPLPNGEICAIEFARKNSYLELNHLYEEYADAGYRMQAIFIAESDADIIVTNGTLYHGKFTVFRHEKQAILWNIQSNLLKMYTTDGIVFSDFSVENLKIGEFGLEHMGLLEKRRQIQEEEEKRRQMEAQRKAEEEERERKWQEIAEARKKRQELEQKMGEEKTPHSLPKSVANSPISQSNKTHERQQRNPRLGSDHNAEDYSEAEDIICRNLNEAEKEIRKIHTYKSSLKRVFF